MFHPKRLFRIAHFVGLRKKYFSLIIALTDGSKLT
jgi:hypothetical protein